MNITKGFDKTNHKKGNSAYFISINRKKQYFKTDEERQAEYERRIAFEALGVGAVAPATARDTIDLEEMRKLAAERHVPLMEIFRAGAKRVPTQLMTLAAARDLFKAEKERSVKAGELKQISYVQQKQAANMLVNAGCFSQLSDLVNPPFEKWLRHRTRSPKTLHSYALALGVFLNFCVRKKLLIDNPLKEIVIPIPKGKRTIWQIDQVETMLALAQKKFPELVPVLAVMWFAGVRPATAVLLDYSDFDRAGKVIQLREGKFSQDDTQFVENFPDTLWHWLPKKKKGPIAPKRVRLKMRAFRKALGFSYKNNPWPKDVARHTFASNFAAFSGSLDKVAFAMNHTGPSTTLRWYRKRIARPLSVRYFGLRPMKSHKPVAAPAEFIPFPKSA